MTSSPRPRLDYANKLILAPMVRIGTLPMRLLALEYGADIVYTEELIDWKLLRSVRRENEVLGTVDYIDKTDGTVVFRTCGRERDRVVLQLGSCDAARALEVGRLVQQDVAGVDLNMGCPKRFSLLGGMGAALLKQPEKARGILASLVQGLEIPVSCKIRVLPSFEDSLALCESLASSGISAIAVHGRTVEERPQHPNRNELVARLAGRLSIPVIASGGSKEIEKRADAERFRRETGCSSVMIARAAQWNCSIFRKEGLLPMEEVIRDYLKLAVDYDNSPSNTKYCLQNVLRELQESPLGRRFLDTQTLEQICEVWNMDDYCRQKSKEYRDKGFRGRFEVEPARLGLLGSRTKPLKRKLEEEDGEVLLMRCAYLRSNYTNDADLPKSRLIKWTQENRKKFPFYVTYSEEKLFRSVVLVDGKNTAPPFGEEQKVGRARGSSGLSMCSWCSR